MSDRRLRQVVHNLKHSKSPHPDTHRGATVLLLRAELRTLLRQRHKLQEPHEDTHRSVLLSLDPTLHLRLFCCLHIRAEARRPVSPQVRNRTCAQCLAARSASQNTPACTNTTWSTRLASRTTATTVGRPTSRSPRSPCTNAQPTTTRSPSRRSRRPTSNPPQVSADAKV